MKSPAVLGVLVLTGAVGAWVSVLTTPMPSPTPTCPPEEFPCKSGECIIITWICDGGNPDCPDGSDEDESFCSNPNCYSGFHCASGHRVCVKSDWVCDGTPDCEDGSDEQDCQGSCDSSEFVCANGKCIPSGSTCNGQDDCGDNSDEDTIICPTTEPPTGCGPNLFTCDDGHCVPDVWYCDGFDDCWDSSDEADCPPHSCSDREFHCASGQCILKELVCDQRDQCGDNSDEDEANCDKNGNCSDGQFSCRSGQCISAMLVCDGKEDCTGGEDETATAGCPSPPTSTCDGLRSIAESINEASDRLFACSVISPCPEVTAVSCAISDGQGMEIVVLPCHLPLPAIRVVNRNATKQLTFDHVFVRSEELPVMFDDLPAILVVNVEPKETSIGITLIVQFLGHTTTYIPHTVIPLNTSDAYCKSTEKSSGEGCDILQSMAESTGPLGCFMADDRQGLLCPLHVPGAQDGVLQVKVLECEEPMAVVLSLLNSSRELFTYTFHQTGGIDLPIAGTKASLYITLDHLRDTVLGVKIVRTLSGQTLTVVPYTHINTSCSQCSTQEEAEHQVTMIVAVSVGGAALVALSVSVIACVVLLCRWGRRKRLEYRRQQFEASLRPLTDASSDEEEGRDN